MSSRVPKVEIVMETTDKLDEGVKTVETCIPRGKESAADGVDLTLCWEDTQEILP